MPQETAVPVDSSLQVDSGTVLLHTSEWYRGLENPTCPLVLVKFPTNLNDQVQEPELPDETGLEGDILLDEKEGLISLTIMMQSDAKGTFQLSFWDKNWTQIEKKLINSYSKFFLKYGYRESVVNPLLITPWLSCMCMVYSLDFKLEGVIIHMQGELCGYTLASNRQYHAAFKDEPIHKVVRDLVDDINAKDCPNDPYLLIIDEPIQDVKITASEQQDYVQMKKGFNLSSASLEIFLNRLAPYCKNKDGTMGYRCFVDRDIDGTKQLHFHPSNFEFATRHPTGQVPLFTLFKDALSPVINFSPDWNSSRTHIQAGSSWSPEISAYNKSLTFSITSKSTDSNNNANGEPEKLNNSVQPPGDPKGNRVVLPHTNYSAKGGINRDHANSVAGHSNASRLEANLGGSLTIVGNPCFNVTEKILIFVYIPKGTDQPDMIHWISGAYLIIGITEHISPQGYTTTFELGTGGSTTVNDEPLSDNTKTPLQEDMTCSPNTPTEINPQKTKQPAPKST